MAKRKTIQEKEIEKITKDSLNELGRVVRVVTARNSKVSNIEKSHLRDSVRTNVKPFNTLNVYQFSYGKWNTPKGKPTPKDRSNIKDTPVLNAIHEHAPKAVKVYIKSIADLLKAPIKKK